MGEWKFELIARRLQQAALEPGLWVKALDDVSRSIGAKGAVLVSTEKQMPGVPMSAEITPMLEDYFKNGWNLRDVRGQRAVPIMLRKGVATDTEFMSAEEMVRSPYYQDWVARHGCRHFAAVGIKAGNDFWCISIQRTVQQGPFEPEELERLATLCRPLSEAATLSSSLGFAQVLGVANGLELVGQAAILLDNMGRILTLNASAEHLVGELVDTRDRTFKFRDRTSKANIERTISECLQPEAVPGPLCLPAEVLDNHGRRISIRAVILRDWGRFTFAGARILLLLKQVKNLKDGGRFQFGLTFGLTPTEERIVAALCRGVSLTQASNELNLTYETARSYLKTIYQKTNTHRQGELVALLLGEKYNAV